ncbi:MAG TPA: 2-dehydropantoate 2-reductase [Eudoraea sp.]|nr:2-dehydropantoate 2-reductase [Eudoraea sp.]
MAKDIRIGILGIGGTGGFFGGKLAHYYKNIDNVKIVFIARNKTKRIIAESGLRVESIEGDFTTAPDLVTDNTAEIGVLDILFVCVKSYSLEEALLTYRNNLASGGVVITIQNVVNQAERVKAVLPDNVQHLEGCAYILSNTIDIARIKHKGGPATVFFGNNADIKEYKWVEDIFVKAGVKATLTSTISETIWKKFLFISPVAVATSYFNSTIGELRDHPEKIYFLEGLMKELFQLIKTKGIGLEASEIENHLRFLEKLPENGKTSLQLDIEQGKPSEIDSLLEYVLKESEKHHIKLPNYKRAYERLKETAL